MWPPPALTIHHGACRGSWRAGLHLRVAECHWRRLELGSCPVRRCLAAVGTEVSWAEATQQVLFLPPGDVIWAAAVQQFMFLPPEDGGEAGKEALMRKANSSLYASVIEDVKIQLRVWFSGCEVKKCTRIVNMVVHELSKLSVCDGRTASILQHESTHLLMMQRMIRFTDGILKQISTPPSDDELQQMRTLRYDDV